MLRKNIRSSVFVLLALAACTSKNNVKITGEIKEARKSKSVPGAVECRSSCHHRLDKNRPVRTFTFKTATSLPTFYNVKSVRRNLLLSLLNRKIISN